MHEDEKRILNDNVVQTILKKQANEHLVLSIILFVVLVLWTVLSCGVISLLERNGLFTIHIYFLIILCFAVFAIYFSVSISEFLIIKKRKYRIVRDTLKDIVCYADGNPALKRRLSRRYYMLSFVPFFKQYKRMYDVHTLIFENYGNFYVQENETQYHSSGDEMFLVVFEYRKKTYIANVFNAKYYHLKGELNE